MRKLVTLGFVALGTSACWSPQYAEDAWYLHAIERSRLEGAIRTPLPDTLWATAKPTSRSAVAAQVGDETVFSVDVETPDRSFRRYLRLTVQDQQPRDEEPVNRGPDRRRLTLSFSREDGWTGELTLWSVFRPVRVEMLDESGVLVGEPSTSNGATDFLAEGFMEAAQLVWDNPDADLPPDDEYIQRASVGAATLFAVVDLLDSDGTLRDLAFELVDTSLIWTVLWNFGVNLSVEPKYEQSEPVDVDPVTGRPGFRVPVQLLVNEKVALRAAVTVVEPFSPLGLAAGVTRIDGFRGSDDRYRFRIEYLPRP